MSIVVSTLIEVCIFSSVNHRPEYLLLHRSKKEDVYPGIWQFISGSIERGETAVEAAYRELEEETGFVPEAFWVVPRVLSFYDHSKDSLNLVPFFAARIPAGSQPVLSEEHTDFAWFSYPDAISRLIWPEWQDGLRIVNEFITTGRDVPRLHRLK